MPSRRSDRGNKLKRQPGESDLALTNRKTMTAVTLAPLFGLSGLGILAGAAAIHTDASAKADEEKKKKKKKKISNGVLAGDTIKQLTDSILQSASGRPFDFSMSDKQDKREASRAALKAMMLNGILSPEITGPFDIEQQLNKFEHEVNVDKAKAKGNPKTVTPEQVRANKKEQRKTST